MNTEDPMDIDFLAKVAGVVSTMLSATPLDDEAAAARIVLLKQMKLAIVNRINDLERSFRVSVDESGDLFETRGSMGRELKVGEVTLRRYRDTVSERRVAENVSAVVELLGRRALPLLPVVKVKEWVQVDALIGLVAAGKLTEEDLDSVSEMVRSTSRGRFTVTASDALKAQLKVS